MTRAELEAFPALDGPSVYLLCLTPPLRSTTGQRVQVARHYLGWGLDWRARVAADLAGRGCNLLRVARATGGTAVVVAVWPGTRALEARLKRCGGRTRFCPRCTPTPRRPRLGLSLSLAASDVPSDVPPF